jgi:hypothetical protein
MRDGTASARGASGREAWRRLRAAHALRSDAPRSTEAGRKTEVIFARSLRNRVDPAFIPASARRETFVHTRGTPGSLSPRRARRNESRHGSGSGWFRRAGRSLPSPRASRGTEPHSAALAIRAGNPGGPVRRRCRHRWLGGALQAGDWTDFTLNGDAAPNDRFNYRAQPHKQPSHPASGPGR